MKTQLDAAAIVAARKDLAPILEAYAAAEHAFLPELRADAVARFRSYVDMWAGFGVNILASVDVGRVVAS